MSRRGWLLFAVMSLIWGIPYLLIRVAVRQLSPADLVFMRTAPAALILLPLAAARGELRPVVKRWALVVVYTAVEIAVPWLLLTRAEKTLTSSLSSLLVATVPLIGAAVARVTGATERLGLRRLAGLGVGLAGVAALVGIDVHGANLGAIGEVLLVAAGYAIGPLLISRTLSDLPPLGVVAASVTITAAAYAPVMAIAPPTRISGETVAAVAGLALICTALAFVLFFILIAEVGPVRATVITYVNPAVAVVLGVILLGEPFTLGIGVGFSLVVVGSVLATRRGQPPGAPVVSPRDPRSAEAAASATSR
ncbi:MAG TPA: DMT family transporter [Acidimicrobiales bacterium]|nr:DMT family transporter [Acidimicrobiales bacterium]